MIKILLILLTPIMWLTCYIVRVIFYDIAKIIYEAILDLFDLHPLRAALRLLISLLTLPLDIVCGVFITLYLSIKYMIEALKGELSTKKFFTSFFKEPKYNTYHLNDAPDSKIDPSKVVSTTDGESFDDKNNIN